MRQFVILFIVMIGILFFSGCGDSDVPHETGGVGTSAETQKLTALDAVSHAAFGTSMDVDGDYAVIGAYGDDENGKDAGAAYIFHYDGSEWIQQAKITASDGQEEDTFGYSVAISGDLVVVGAPGESENGSNAGAVYVFWRNDSNSTWTQHQKFPNVYEDVESGDNFGMAVGATYVSETNEHFVLAGATGNDDAGHNAGAVYIFRQAGTTGFIFINQFLPIEGSSGAQLGSPIDADGKWAVVGAVTDPHGGSNSGSAYIYRMAGVQEWEYVDRILANNEEAGDHFGSGLGIDGDYIVVGAPGDDDAGEDAGAAYIFHRDANSDWHQQAKFTAMDFSGGAEFGYAADLDGNFTVVSAMMDHENGIDSGSAYLFKRDGTTWLPFEKFTASDAAAYDYFGGCVGISGNYAFAGSSFKDDGSGAVYAFDSALFQSSLLTP